jgi:surfactin synthase thioesterase subunit
MIADHRQHDSIPAIAASILEKAPEKFSLAGLSMGGYIAMEIMRIARRTGEPPGPARHQCPRGYAGPDRTAEFLIDLTRKRDFKKVPHLLYPGFVHESREEDEELKAIVFEMAMDTGAGRFHPADDGPDPAR